jgi:hypothetical protein
VRLYTRHQLALLLIALGVGGLGLAVGEWRRAHPDLAARVERLAGAPEAPAARSRATPARTGADRPGPATTPEAITEPAGADGAPGEIGDPAPTKRECREPGTSAPPTRRRNSSARPVDLDRVSLAELTRLCARLRAPG